MTHSSGSLLNDVRNDPVRHVMLCVALAAFSFVFSSWTQSLFAAHGLALVVGGVGPAVVLMVAVAVAPGASMPVMELSSKGLSVVGRDVCIPWGFLDRVEYHASYQLLAAGLTMHVRSRRGTMALNVVPAGWIVSALEDAPEAPRDVLREAVGAVSDEDRDLDLAAVARLELLVFRRRVSFAASCGAVTLAGCAATLARTTPTASVILGVVAAAAMIAGLIWLRAKTAVQLGDQWLGWSPGASGPLAGEGQRLVWASVLLRRMLVTGADFVTLEPLSTSRRAGVPYRTAEDAEELESATAAREARALECPPRVVLRPTMM